MRKEVTGKLEMGERDERADGFGCLQRECGMWSGCCVEKGEKMFVFLCVSVYGFR